MTRILPNLNNFHSLEVVSRVSETQLQVNENCSWTPWRLKGGVGDVSATVSVEYVR